MSRIKSIAKVLICFIFYGIFYWLTWLYSEDFLNRRDPANDFLIVTGLSSLIFIIIKKYGDPYVIKQRRKELDKFIRSLKNIIKYIVISIFLMIIIWILNIFLDNICLKRALWAFVTIAYMIYILCFLCVIRIYIYKPWRRGEKKNNVALIPACA